METRLNMKHKLDEWMFDTNHDGSCAKLCAAMAGEADMACECGYDAAVDELSSLRQRCEDLELMLRAACCRDTYGWSHSMNLANEHFFERTRQCSDEDCDAAHLAARYILLDDGTGLPILTAEAREALRGGR